MIERLTYIETDNTNPYHNLALEEMLLENVEKNQCILYLWQNKNTVVIGRNQNSWKECKVEFLEENGGNLVRRLSGGGAVFHDLGNLNFTFLVHKENYSVERQLQVIIKALEKFGLKAEKNGRNDITVDGRKFSGNAFYQLKDNCYHHGTLMVNVNMQDLSKYLNVSKDKLKSKGVDSVKSRVINLSSLCEEITISSLKDKLFEAFGEVYNCTPERLDEESIDKVLLQEKIEKFGSWDWKYGRKINFQYEISNRFDWGDIQLQFGVKSGVIDEIGVYSDAMEQDFILNLSQLIDKTIFNKAAICDKLASYKCENDIEEKMIGDIVGLIKEQDI